MTCGKPTWFGIKAAEDYHEKDDYHTGETLKGSSPQFCGEIAEKLGLKWTPQTYGAALRGKTPGIAEHLGAPMSGVKAACDFTLSPPKSVSFAALGLQDETVVLAHERAVDAAAKALSRLAQYRYTENGRTVTEYAEGALFSKFTHCTSRKRDPNRGAGPGGDMQLHTHLMAHNLVHCKDGKYRALESLEMFRAQKTIGAIYRAELAKQLQLAGHKLRWTKDAFEIVGVSDELIKHFSCGRQSMIAAVGQEAFDKMSPRQRDQLNKAERDSKLSLDRSGLHKFWETRAEAIGQPLSDVKLARMSAAEQERSLKPRMTAMEAVDRAIAIRTERESTIRHDHDLVTTALHECNYSVDHIEIRKAIAAKRRAGDLIVTNRRTGEMTTREILDNESAVDALYQRGIGQAKPISTHDAALEEIRLTEEHATKTSGRPMRLTDGQKAAIVLTATSTNRVHVWQGYAGVGKSTSFASLNWLAKKNGRKLMGLGPHGKAVDALRESKLDAWTAQKAACSEKWWDDVDANTIVVCDEFGKFDSAMAKKILERAEARGATVILSGDVEQWAAVAAGSPAHQLHTQARNAGALIELDEMMRGRTDDAKRLHVLSRDDQAESVIEMFKQDRVRSFSNANQRYEYIAREFAALPAAEQEKALVITGMNRDRAAINLAVRKATKLEPGVTIDTYVDKKLEAGRMANHVNYELGDIIRFGSRTGAFQKGESVRILSNDDGNLVVERKSGQKREVKVADICTRIGLGSSEKIEVSKGDIIQFTASIESLRIGTKEQGRVLELDHKTRDAKIRLFGTGETVTVNMREFGAPIRYGYCQTSDGAQGATGKGRVWGHMTSDDPTVNRNGWYTNVTRMTDHFEWVTDVKEADRILAMQAKASKALAPDFADKSRKAAEGSIAKKAFSPGDRIWANVGAANIRFEVSPTDDDIAEMLVANRQRLGNKLHVTGSADFQRRVARVVGERQMIDDNTLAGITFRVPKLNEIVAETAARQAAQRAAQAAAAPVAAAQKPVETTETGAPVATAPVVNATPQTPTPTAKPAAPENHLVRPDFGPKLSRGDTAKQGASRGSRH